MARTPTVAFFPEPGAWGPTNNLVALGNHLRERGLAERMKRISAELTAAPGRIKGADLIEQMVRTGPPVPAA